MAPVVEAVAKDTPKESPAILPPPRSNYASTPSTVQSPNPLTGPSKPSKIPASSQPTLPSEDKDGENVSGAGGGLVKAQKLPLALETTLGKKKRPRKIIKLKVPLASLSAITSISSKLSTAPIDSSPEDPSSITRSSLSGARSSAKQSMNIRTPSPESGPPRMPSKTSRISLGVDSDELSSQSFPRPQGKGRNVSLYPVKFLWGV